MGIVKKYAKKAKRAVVKRYTKKAGGANYAKMAKDIVKLQSVLNPEKKRFNFGNVNTSQSAVAFGQVNANLGGYFALDITPLPAQGITDITRNGDSIKLHSSDMKLQFTGQSNMYSAFKMKYFIVQTLGVTYTSAGAAILDLLSPNTFNNQYDFNSDRNYDVMGRLRILRRGTWALPSTGAVNSSIHSIHDRRLGMKYKNHHVKFVNNSQTIGTGQIFLFLFADSGNCSNTTSSTIVNIPVTATSSGVTLNYDITHFFYDN